MEVEYEEKKAALMQGLNDVSFHSDSSNSLDKSPYFGVQESEVSISPQKPQIPSYKHTSSYKSLAPLKE